MKKKIILITALSCLSVLILLIGPAAAAGDAGKISYDKKQRLLTIHADMTSCLALLQDVETKTGIKITIRGGIRDKYVTLNTEELPISRIDTLLDELSLSNAAMIYDQKGNISEIVILPGGTPSLQMNRRR